MNTKKILTSITIGIIVLAAAFVAVFGSSLKNLKLDTDDTVVTTETPTQNNTAVETKPVPSTTVITTPATKPTVPTQPSPVSTRYTLADVATHNSATSCWSAVNGNVYDLTNWVNSHPGGKAAILMICGKDGSPLFNSQHGGDRKPANILAKYKIAALN